MRGGWWLITQTDRQEEKTTQFPVFALVGKRCVCVGGEYTCEPQLIIVKDKKGNFQRGLVSVMQLFQST